MVKVYAFRGVVPVVDATAFVHPAAVLIGDVVVGAGSYIGPGASLRGDFGRMIVGQGANVQDNCVMHGFPETDTVVEDWGHIGHGAVLHGCRIGRNAMIGMNSVVMDGVEIGESAFVAAMSFVKAGTKIPPRSLAQGIPAKVVRELRDEEIEWKEVGTRGYQQLASEALTDMVETEALSEIPAERRNVGRPKMQPKYKSREGE
jgi:phenylacetic acid degradation protein